MTYIEGYLFGEIKSLRNNIELKQDKISILKLSAEIRSSTDIGSY